jgi:hypothetical protein
MSRTLARVDIVTAVQAAAASFAAFQVVVDYDNKNLVDYAAQVKPYLAVDIIYYDGQQMDLGAKPLVGAYGQIALAVCTQEGKGVLLSDQLMDHLVANLQLKDWPLVRTQAARPQPSRTVKGWYTTVTFINFWYHTPS